MIKWLLFHLKMYWLEESPLAIRFFYAITLEADLPDFTETQPGSRIYLKATGNEIHIKDTILDIEFVMHDDEKGRVRVDKKVPMVERTIDGHKMQVPWIEVYRENVHATDLSFVSVLKKIRVGFVMEEKA